MFWGRDWVMVEELVKSKSKQRLLVEAKEIRREMKG